MAALPFEQDHDYAEGYINFDGAYSVNKPGAWMRLYSTMHGYCLDFGWRACFLGGGE